MKTPDITPAQIAALVQAPVTATVAALVVLGVLDLDATAQAAILSAVGAWVTFLGTAIVIADALIRRGRAGVAAAQETAKGDRAIAEIHAEQDRLAAAETSRRGVG